MDYFQVISTPRLEFTYNNRLGNIDTRFTQVNSIEDALAEHDNTEHGGRKTGEGDFRNELFFLLCNNQQNIPMAVVGCVSWMDIGVRSDKVALCSQ